MDTPSLDPSLIAAVKGFEGFTPKAQWDYKQHSNGYGTRAAAPGETIDQPTADARLTAELGKAQAQVDGFAPNLPPGARNALSSLTFNAGPGWMGSGLGDAVKSGDWNKAQSIFLTYNKAGGQENPGLTARRQQEAQWFGQPPMPAPFQAIPAASAPSGMPLFGNVQQAQPTMQQAQQTPQQMPQTVQNAGSFFAQLPPAPMQDILPPDRSAMARSAILQSYLQSLRQS